MGIIQNQIRDEIRRKFREQIALKYQLQNQPQKTVSGFAKNLVADITRLTKGIVGLGYQAVRHPIESGRTVKATAWELGKVLPSSTKEGLVSAWGITKHPIRETKKAYKSWQDLRNIPYKEQKEFFSTLSEQSIQETERGKKGASMLAIGIIGAFSQEISHPMEYFYENPFTMTLDALLLGKASGVSKFVSKPVSTAAMKVPAVQKMSAVMKEAFTPHGKLVSAGYGDLANNFMKTKSTVFKVQKTIVEDTSNQFTRVFKLNKVERLDFFNSIDKLRRAEKGVVATSKNPKVQTAINWWLKEEAPKLAKLSGLPKEKAIVNYLHHFFPEKTKGFGIKPLEYAKKGYLKKSKDVEGFTKDPILSISAIKSKVSIDIIKDAFISKTIKKYSLSKAKIEQILTKEIGIEKVIQLKKAGKLEETAKKILNLDEFKPKGTLRFYPLEKGIGVTKRVETHFMPRVIVDELTKFTIPKSGILDKMLLPFDVFNRNWKPLATALRIRYHTRNVASNIYNAVVIGKTSIRQIPIAMLNQVRNHIHQSIKANNVLGKVYKGIYKKGVPEPEIMKLAIDNDVVGRGFFAADLDDLARAIDKSDDIMRTIKKIKTPAEIYKIPVLKQWLGLSRKAGEFLEDNARLAMFQHGIKKWGRTARGIQKSKNYVNEHLFDYLTGLGEADKLIKRIVPFWAWTRFNIPLQLKSLWRIPERHIALQRGSVGYVTTKEMEDEGYEYLSEKQKEMGYFKVGTTIKGSKEYDKYIKTASVLPQQDLTKLVNIFRGQSEEIGFTPLFQIYDYICKAPTEVLNYFGQPIEKFKGEKKKFLELSITGRAKALLGTIPVLTELNKLIGGSYKKGEKPELSIRLETVLSPPGLTLVDKDTTKFYHELEKEKKISGSWEAGWTTLYKRNFKVYKKTNEKYAKDNMETLEKLLLSNGLTQLDLLKLKSSAVKSLFQELIRDKLKQ